MHWIYIKNYMRLGSFVVVPTERKIQICAGGTGQGGVQGWLVGPSC